MSRFRVIVFLMIVLARFSTLGAQTTAAEDPARSARVALLPLSNYAEETEVMPEIVSLVRSELERRHVVLVDPQKVADALRAHRVRNTNLLSVDQIHNLSEVLGADYLLVGSLDRFVKGSTDAEVALSARLIYAPTMNMQWVGTASQHSSDGIRLLDVGREHDSHILSRKAVAQLFRDFRYSPPLQRYRVESVKLLHGNQVSKQACERILVIPLANESGLYNAGGIVYNHLIDALDGFGYEVIEPGRAREAMMEEGDLTPGKASTNLMKICRDELGVNLILTGTVSTFDCATTVNMEQVPSISMEARLIDVQSGQVVWARTFQGDGNDTRLLFGVGTTYSASSVAERLARKVVKAIPANRAKKI